MRIISTRLARLSALLLAAGLLALSIVPADAGTRRIALGVTMRSTSMASYDDFTASGGRAPAIWMLWRDWLGSNTEFPNAAVLNHMNAQGTVPMISWSPWDPEVRNLPQITYNKILAGKFDAYIREFAR